MSIRHNCHLAIHRTDISEPNRSAFISLLFGWTPPFNLSSGPQRGARLRPALHDTHTHTQADGWRLTVQWMVPDSTHTTLNTPPQAFTSTYRRSHTHAYWYICHMVYMRYSLCLVLYCIQRGKHHQPLSSDVQAQEWRDTEGWVGAFEMHKPSAVFSSAKRKLGGEERKWVFGLSTGKNGQRKGNARLIWFNDHRCHAVTDVGRWKFW